MINKLLKIPIPRPKSLFILFCVLIMVKATLLIHEIITGGMSMMVAFRETLSMVTVLVLVAFIFSKNKD